MYIEPNTTINFYSGVPLDNRYLHTLYFPTSNDQGVYFTTTKKPKFTIENSTYQRVNSNRLRVGLTADNLYDCNYMAFFNNNYSGKWFFASNTSVEYVSNVSSEITYEIDVMQTYLFDVTRKRCFVEREHSSTDVPGDNIVKEPIDTGDIICYDQQSQLGNQFDDYSAVITRASKGAGGIVSGLFSGCQYVKGSINNTEQVQTLVNYLSTLIDANQQDTVVSIAVFPTFFCTTDVSPKSVEVNISRNNKLGRSLNTYTPKNKKLLTYPYNYLNVDCGSMNKDYRYEWFGENSSDNGKAVFRVIGCMTSNPTIGIYPLFYNGSGNVVPQGLNYSERMLMDGFPQVAWSIDAYRAWLSQQASGQGIQLGTAIATTTLSAVAQSAGGVAGGISSIAGTINSGWQASRLPDIMKGSNSGTVDTASRKKGIYFNRMGVTVEYAKIIDNFFDLYGYAVNKVKVPNISSRPHWNYVKTNGCILIGKCPADDIAKMEKIYDNGITFWKKGSEVGNYNLDNGV